MESAVICSLGVDCESAPSTRTYCHRLDSGLWECQCTEHDNLYRLEGAAGLDACALAARLCSAEELALGEEQCEVVDLSATEESCVSDVTCVASIDQDAAPGVQASLVRSGSARCSAPSSTLFHCDCVDGARTTPRSVLANNGASPCHALAEVCLQREPIVFDDGEVCAPMVEYGDSGYCARNGACGPRQVLTDDVSLLEGALRVAECKPGPADSSDCLCFTGDLFFHFRLSMPLSAASCEAATPNCDPSAVIEAKGPARCDPPTALGYQDGCEGSMACVQDATVDGRSVEAHGEVAVACRRSGQGMPWYCSCATGPSTGMFNLGAPDASDVQACEQASHSCLERLGLHLGLAEEYVSAPTPVP